jgi:hypothetical protein
MLTIVLMTVVVAVMPWLTPKEVTPDGKPKATRPRQARPSKCLSDLHE